jgi:uncharacterized protein YkwD
MNTRSLRLIIVLVLAMVFAGSLVTHSAQAASVAPRKALLDRINVVRARYGLAHVLPAAKLRGAAQRHSIDMLHRNYFAHTSPVGSSVYTRITNSGFVSGYSSWLGGETLAWGTGSLEGAHATVYAWMHSPEHRAILLSSKFRWIGISRECGRYHGFANACVWTADWVTRS